MPDVPLGNGAYSRARGVPLIGSAAGSAAHNATSTKHFADSARCRYEVAGADGPACLAAVIGEASLRGSTIRRSRRGGGEGTPRAADLCNLAKIASAARVAVRNSATPTAGWGLSAQARAPQGATSSGSVLG